MSVNLLFLNNEDMDRLGAGDMQAAIHDVERAYVLVEQGGRVSPRQVRDALGLHSGG